MTTRSVFCAQSLRHLKSASPLRVGLLGGSFNPAHPGHVHISLEALRRLHLDKIIWLVSPANPLKDPQTLAAFEKRYRYAKKLVSHPDIIVSAYEQRHNLRYTWESIKHLQQHFPQHQFIWLMGGDNLASFHRWQGWKDIACAVPIAVLDRAPFATAALRSHAAQWMSPYRRYYRTLASSAPPAWDYVPIRRNGESATHLRELYGKNSWQSAFFDA